MQTEEMKMSNKALLRAASGILALAFLSAGAANAEDAAMKAYMQSMEKMNADMQKGMDRDPTKAWAKMMIAHHQGAIDMSETVLKETKDPTIRKMAEKGMDEQKKEQRMLKEWLSKHD
ncbi:MAG: DUF305 domain-containing protein [Bradyrhizobium sp.]|jgi:uncharacterized protein (DUF305 family)|nr:DUF305 domain-containing protein [Bradyrhizobium sp.]